MTGPLAHLAGLKRLTETVMEADLARLDEATRACRALQERIAGLDRSPTRIQAADELSAIVLAERMALFQAWRHLERTRLNTRLATCLSEREAVLAQARNAFGRDQAVSGLREKLQQNLPRL